MTIIILIALAFIGYLITQYNKAQSLAQDVIEGHSNVVVTMKKRVDLINKLIDIAKSYGDHEKLTHLTISQNDSFKINTANSNVDGTLIELDSISTSFPELKANETYQKLMEDLGTMESEVQNKRENYNANVKNYNKLVTAIPFVFLAPHLGFKAASYFDAGNSESLENIKEFTSGDGEALKTTLKNIGNSSLHLAEDMTKKGRELIDKKR